MKEEEGGETDEVTEETTTEETEVKTEEIETKGAQSEVNNEKSTNQPERNKDSDDGCGVMGIQSETHKKFTQTEIFALIAVLSLIGTLKSQGYKNEK